MSTAPRRIGKYELQQQLGKGNMGEVWKAHDLSLHNNAAIKILHSDVLSDPHFMTHFATAGSLITSLHHTNLVPVYEFTVTRPVQSNETVPYVAMDYIEGQTLAQYIHTTSHRGNIPPISEILYLFTSIGAAVDYVHQNSLIHGNIKPANILLNKHNITHFAAGEPLLTDIGITQVVSSIESAGAPFYISPEQAAGDPLTARSDIYALGVILYEICTGVAPFRGESPITIMMQHINALPTPPTLINPHIPAALSEVILRAMSKDPTTRFARATLFAEAIADACSIQASQGSVLELARKDSAGRPLPSAILGVSQPYPVVSPISSGRLQPLQRLPSRPAASATQQPGVSAPLTLAAEQTISGPLTANAGQQATLTRPTRSTKTLPTTPASSPSSNRLSIPVESLRTPVQSSVPVSSLRPSASMRAVQFSSRFPANAPQPSVSRPLNVTFPTLTKGRSNFNDMPIYLVIGILVLLLIVLGSAIGGSLLLNRAQTITPKPQGQVFFQDDALGNSDQLRVDMQNMSSPPSGETYFAWFKTTNQLEPLGPMTYNNGKISFLYAGTNQHTNLLATAEGFTVTLENTGSSPTTPSAHAVFQATYNNMALQYLKNILYSTPGLPARQSVIVDLFETIKSMNDKSVSIVDSIQGSQVDYGLVRRQATRIVEMLERNALCDNQR